MKLDNKIVLRPRFNIDLKTANNIALNTLDATKTQQNDFIISRVDDHVFIRFPKQQQHFWSPQLHLEITEIDQNSSKLHGLFGPNPTVWTLFMFLHFIVTILFIAAGIWAYSNWKLKTNYSLQLAICLLMVVAWFALYFIGRLGKAKGKPDMMKLYKFMETTLNL